MEPGESRGPRKRLAPLALVAVGAALYFTLSPRWPKTQTLHVVLGNASPLVQEVRLRYADAGRRDPSEDWTREVAFRYAIGSAPRVVTHEARLPDGDYVVQIDLTLASGPGVQNVNAERRASLHEGGATSIDVSADALSRAGQSVAR